MNVAWDDSKHSLGIDAIDDQHKQFFLITNGLYKARENPVAHEREKAFDVFLHQLFAYARYHFATEEEIMEAHSFPGLVQHKELHKQFIEKLKDMKEKAGEGSSGRMNDLLDFLVQWIVFHIRDEDRKHVVYYKENGISIEAHCTPGAVKAGETRGTDILKLWHDKQLGLNIATIDHQHKELISILQQANDLLLARPERQKVFLPVVIEKLKHYIQFHFSFEEELMSRHHYKNLEFHRTMHAEFIKETLTFPEKFRRDDPGLPEEIVTFLKDWIVHHILAEDRKFKDLVRD